MRLLDGIFINNLVIKKLPRTTVYFKLANVDNVQLKRARGNPRNNLEVVGDV